MYMFYWDASASHNKTIHNIHYAPFIYRLPCRFLRFSEKGQDMKIKLFFRLTRAQKSYHISPQTHIIVPGGTHCTTIIYESSFYLHFYFKNRPNPSKSGLFTAKAASSNHYKRHKNRGFPPKTAFYQQKQPTITPAAPQKATLNYT